MNKLPDNLHAVMCQFASDSSGMIDSGEVAYYGVQKEIDHLEDMGLVHIWDEQQDGVVIYSATPEEGRAYIEEHCQDVAPDSDPLRWLARRPGSLDMAMIENETRAALENAMGHLMSDWSEATYCAGWLGDLPNVIWHEFIRTGGRSGGDTLLTSIYQLHLMLGYMVGYEIVKPSDDYNTWTDRYIRTTFDEATQKWGPTL